MPSDSKHSLVKPHITIYPDHGGGAWYWLNFDGTGSLQGGASSCVGTWSQHRAIWKNIPKQLLDDFEEWHLIYRRNASNFDEGLPSIDWPSFHRAGIQLSVRLKQAIGEGVRVFYEKPMEDPNDHLNQRREVLIDGQLV